MAYTKQSWENTPSTDTPISAQALNHMEDGIEAAHDGLDGKAATSHNHNASAINAGTLDAARMPTGYKAVHVGTSPPGDTTAIWIDTN